MRHPFGPEDAKRFYDRFGKVQDAQIYEWTASNRLVTVCDFEHAATVFERGCGTGWLVARLLDERFAEHTRYAGVDVSSTMIVTRRLAHWDKHATVSHVGGTRRSLYADATFDRFVATYVLDLLSDATIANVLREPSRNPTDASIWRLERFRRPDSARDTDPPGAPAPPQIRQQHAERDHPAAASRGRRPRRLEMHNVPRIHPADGAARLAARQGTDRLHAAVTAQRRHRLH